MNKPERPKTKLVEVPSTNIIPERDIGMPPILETRHLGIDFGDAVSRRGRGLELQVGESGADLLELSAKLLFCYSFFVKEFDVLAV